MEDVSKVFALIAGGCAAVQAVVALVLFLRRKTEGVDWEETQQWGWRVFRRVMLLTLLAVSVWCFLSLPPEKEIGDRLITSFVFGMLVAVVVVQIPVLVVLTLVRLVSWVLR